MGFTIGSSWLRPPPTPLPKCALGISDNLATNVLAQAGKCRVPVIDLEDTARLKLFDASETVVSPREIGQALACRKRELSGHG